MHMTQSASALTIRSESSALNTTDSMSVDMPLAPIVRLWALRMLVPMGGHRRFIGERDVADDAILSALTDSASSSKRKADLRRPPQHRADALHFDGKKLLKQLHEWWEASEANAAATALPPQLSVNLARLAAHLSLTSVETSILSFAVLLHTDQVLANVGNQLGELSSATMYRSLANVLRIRESAVRDALAVDGRLNGSGLVEMGAPEWSPGFLHDQLSVLSRRFADLIVSSDADPIKLIRDVVFPSTAPTLSVQDYNHVAADVQVLQTYVQHAVDKGRRGVNALLYGTPGTGKTELARLIASTSQLALFEIASSDGSNRALDVEQRLKALCAAQAFVENGRSVLLFDEAEDVFEGGVSWLRVGTVGKSRKAQVNKLLEDNAVATIWIANSVESMDEAFLRRFDIVMQLPIPPLRQRQRIIEVKAGGLIDAMNAARLAEIEQLSPAVIARSADVINAIHADLAERDIAAADCFERLLSGSLQAQGFPAIVARKSTPTDDIYDPLLLQCDGDVAALTQGVRRSQSGRLCLYGPSGTGKSAYARYLAEQLDRRLHVTRGADLLDKYVGESEKRLARAFSDADAQRAVLLIDEVDGFLQDRRGAAFNWEVTLVNEMLTQIEAFNGVLVVTTNLMSELDQAALRRFDIKLRFDFMSADASSKLLSRWCELLRIADQRDRINEAHGRLRRQRCVTPGDFAAVARQHRLHPVLSPCDFVRRLEHECSLKSLNGHASRAVGFVH
jgi:transitional endoplasmic reticulum ATPase